ncbi:DNA adenine methylase [Verminephrobacter aporrectodeae]|uniref:DNA adenine methylase n=1 Tax=Verminephrobacter aporrectodeae TaxID=1110389 RepID=UPI002244B37C|nr:DNA adenine methylase [Verminephrobacter aporrectodeae]
MLNRTTMLHPQRTPKRPVLIYHGGKWRIAPWIIQNFPEHQNYVEPFGGGGSVLLRKPRARVEVYNDLDADLVNLFKVIRDRGADLKQALENTPFARGEFAGSYEKSDDPLERARRTVIRSFMGFGSSSHTNRTTGFRKVSIRLGTTPALTWANYPDALVLAIERLRGVLIENKDALSLIREMDGQDTMVYADPPYVLSTRDKGLDYHYEMTDDDHRALADCLRHCRSMVVLSGYASDLYDQELYPDWQHLKRKTFTDSGRARTEVLWINPACSAALIAQQSKVNK